MKITLGFLALLGVASAAPKPVSNADPSPLLQKRCAAGTDLYNWCTSACNYNCQVRYPCRNSPPPFFCGEAYGRYLSTCLSCCTSGDCRSCQNCGNSYPNPMPA